MVRLRRRIRSQPVSIIQRSARSMHISMIADEPSMYGRAMLEALEGFQLCAKLEGIIPALETLARDPARSSCRA